MIENVKEYFAGCDNINTLENYVWFRNWEEYKNEFPYELIIWKDTMSEDQIKKALINGMDSHIVMTVNGELTFGVQKDAYNSYEKDGVDFYLNHK